MVRTQVYLPKQLSQAIKFVAKRERKPEAQVIRELLADGLGQKQQVTIGHGLAALVTLGKKLQARGPSDLSQNIDHYLYEN